MYTMEYYSAKKKMNEIMSSVEMWVDLETEWSKSEREK